MLKAGVKDPIADPSGVAVYTEIGPRTSSIPVDATLRRAGRGPGHRRNMSKPTDDGSMPLAETRAVLR